MLAVTASGSSATDPLRHLDIGFQPDPRSADGWTTVTVRAASLNRHDLWMLQAAESRTRRSPVILGTDAAGVSVDGTDVVVLPVIGDPAAGRGDETMDPRRTLLGDDHHGTFAERVACPQRNLVPKPSSLTFETAACLPGAWLTAYRMLFGRVSLEPGSIVLVQGAGGVSTALIVLGAAAGYRMWVTSGDELRRKRAEVLGAEAAFPTGERLPGRVDAVMETVGEATWSHSLRSVRAGGYVVVSGATTGPRPSADLQHVFFRQLTIVGTTLGTRDQLKDLMDFVVAHRLSPAIDRVLPLTRAREGFQALLDGDVFGKVVFTVR